MKSGVHRVVFIFISFSSSTPQGNLEKEKTMVGKEINPLLRTPFVVNPAKVKFKK